MAADRRRDRKLARAGYLTVLLVWENLDDDAAPETAGDLHELLGS